MSSLAMTFVLAIDEMVYDTFGSNATKHILRELDGYMYKYPEEDAPNRKTRATRVPKRPKFPDYDIKMLDRHVQEARDAKLKWYKMVWLLVPKKFVAAVCL